jgi:hypothetical protein
VRGGVDALIAATVFATQAMAARKDVATRHGQGPYERYSPALKLTNLKTFCFRAHRSPRREASNRN